MINEIKADRITRGIKNCRFSRLFKGCSPLQLLCNLTGNRPQAATFHTATVVHNYFRLATMTEIDLERLTEIDEYKAILELSDKATEFLEDQNWCVKTIRIWYDFGIYDKIGVFLFQIEPLNDTVDEFIWVIVGDLPTVYLDQSVLTGQEALRTYCELMTDWSENILNGKSVADCYPVNTSATIKNAELLKSRIKFIKRELLSTEQE